MFRIEFWKTVGNFIVLLSMYLKKDTYYSLEILEDSMLECLRDLYAWKNHNCWYWQLKEREE